MLQQLIVAILLSVLSALVHALGLLGLVYWQTKQWPQIESDFCPRRNVPVFLVLFGVILCLHLAEICLWAGFYFWRGGLPSFEASLYFSAASYSTVGYGDVVLPGPWRLVGALESLTGVLLLGWSAAFFFSVVSRFFEIRSRLWRSRGPS